MAAKKHKELKDELEKQLEAAVGEHLEHLQSLEQEMQTTSSELQQQHAVTSEELHQVRRELLASKGECVGFADAPLPRLFPPPP